MTRSTGNVLKGGHRLVVIQQPTKYSYCVISAWKECWRLPCRSRQPSSNQGLILCEIATEDGCNFAPNPEQLRLQIGRENAGRVGVIYWDVRRNVHLRSRRGGPGERDAQDPQDGCESRSYECPCVSIHRCPSSYRT